MATRPTGGGIDHYTVVPENYDPDKSECTDADMDADSDAETDTDTDVDADADANAGTRS